jgi:pimeloyl-ACP methyl ester carboxylesterase
VAPTSRVIDLDGPVHYLTFGAKHGQARGRTPLVLVHGLGGSHANWLSVADQLAEHAPVYALDLAGFGKSPIAGRTALIDDNRALLDRFLDRVVGGPATLVGNSMGGLISMMQAVARPWRVERLVLVNPSLPKPRGVPLDKQVALVFATYMLPVIGPYLFKKRSASFTPTQAIHETMQLCCKDPSRIDPAVLDEMIRVATHRRTLAGGDEAFLEAARSIVALVLRHGRFLDLVRRVQQPTLLLHGVHDRLVPIASARAAATMRPDWEFVVFDDGGHVPQLEHPERFLDAVGSWLARDTEGVAA